MCHKYTEQLLGMPDEGLGVTPTSLILIFDLSLTLSRMRAAQVNFTCAALLEVHTLSLFSVAVYMYLNEPGSLM